jgi:hypothetical protein
MVAVTLQNKEAYVGSKVVLKDGDIIISGVKKCCKVSKMATKKYCYNYEPPTIDVYYGYGYEEVKIPRTLVAIIHKVSKELIEKEYDWFDRTKEEAEKKLYIDVIKVENEIMTENETKKDMWLKESYEHNARQVAMNRFSKNVFRNWFMDEYEWAKDNSRKFYKEELSTSQQKAYNDYFRK